MPSRRTRLKCGPIFTLLAVVFLVPAVAQGQIGGVTLQGRVSETVALSVVPNFTYGNTGAEVVSTSNTVRMTLTSTDAKVVRVPLLVRSNSSFKISATVESTNLLTQLSITDVRATGSLVSPAAISGLQVPAQFDLRGSGDEAATSSSLETPRELLLASGPRVSLGGTLDSPTNALQITVLIRLTPLTDPGQAIHLTFAAAPLVQ